MKLAIIHAGTVTEYYDILDKKLNDLIETSNCFLFTVLCGYVEGRRSEEETLSETWARINGAPLLYIQAKTTEKLINKMLLEADYVIFILNGNPIINNAFMKYRMMGKHGTVIKP